MLRPFAKRETRDLRAVAREKAEGERGPLFRYCAQHPPDRLADEELFFMEERRGDPLEEREVAAARAKHVVLREERDAPDPHFRIFAPSSQDRTAAGCAFYHVTDDLRR